MESEKTIDCELWKPTLSYKLVDGSTDADTLNTREIKGSKIEGKFMLEKEYEIKGSLPRSFFVLFQQFGFQEVFVFDFPPNKWFSELSGLRKVIF